MLNYLRSVEHVEIPSTGAAAAVQTYLNVDKDFLRLVGQPFVDAATVMVRTIPPLPVPSLWVDQAPADAESEVAVEVVEAAELDAEAPAAESRRWALTKRDAGFVLLLATYFNGAENPEKAALALIFALVVVALMRGQLE